MSCPLYKDFTRECIKDMKELEQINSFDFCESDGYEDCPTYKIITGKVLPCEFMEKCRKRRDVKDVDFETIKRFANDFCLSENKVNCEVYKLYNSGKNVPDELHPDGTKSKIEIEE